MSVSREMDAVIELCRAELNKSITVFLRDGSERPFPKADSSRDERVVVIYTQEALWIFPLSAILAIREDLPK